MVQDDLAQPRPDLGERWRTASPEAIAGGAHDPAAAVQTLRSTLADAPKSRRWKLRDKVGERKRWYDLPEETAHH